MLELFKQAEFITGARRPAGFPPDQGVEVAFAGRSNAGKSSALNTLTGRRALARVSKAPGRTREINFFRLDAERMLVDLPGYGYAKVAEAIKDQWHIAIDHYLQHRRSLAGLVLLMDCRHPFSAMDEQLLRWCCEAGLPVHVLLTKADKLSRGQAARTLLQARKRTADGCSHISVQLFSSLKRDGVEELSRQVTDWLKV